MATETQDPYSVTGEESCITDGQENCIYGKWNLEEDDCLRKAIEKYGEGNWKRISTMVVGRSPLQCLNRWTKTLKPGLIKGFWSPEENSLLRRWVAENGLGNWSGCGKMIIGRSGKQCREHWFNKLDPKLKKGKWTKEEDEQIFQLYQKYGTSWSKFENFLPGRTENTIKNRFYGALRRVHPRKAEKRVKKESKVSLDSLDAVYLSQVDSIEYKLEQPFFEKKETINSVLKLTPQTKLTSSLEEIPNIQNQALISHRFTQKNKSFIKTEIGVALSREESQAGLKKELKEEYGESKQIDLITDFRETTDKQFSFQPKQLNIDDFVDYNYSEGPQQNIASPLGLAPDYEKFSFMKTAENFQARQNPRAASKSQRFFKIPKSDPGWNLSQLQPQISGLYQRTDNVAMNHLIEKEQQLNFVYQKLESLEEMIQATKSHFLNKLNQIQLDAGEKTSI